MQQEMLLADGVINFRDDRIDRIKGIAIFLMVYGHASPFCRPFIYQFHLAVFLMASGLCYKDNIRTGKDFLRYFLRKLRSFYLPYVVLNGLVVLCMNGLIHLNLYTNDPRFLIDTQNYIFPQVLTEPLDKTEMWNQLKLVLLFHNTTQIGTASWFLTALFEILIFHSILSLIINRFSNKTFFYVVLLIGTTWLAWFLNVQDITFLNPERCLPGMYAPFLLGILLRRVQWDGTYPWLVAICSFGIIYVFSQYQVVELSLGMIGNPVLYLLGSLSGWYLLEAIARIMKNTSYAGRFCAYVGKHTLGIFCLHILAFKLVSLLYVRINHRPDYLIASFHIIFDANELWRALYGIAGVLLPLLLIFLLEKCKNIFIELRDRDI